jgi:hypothetical protein
MCLTPYVFTTSYMLIKVIRSVIVPAVQDNGRSLAYCLTRRCNQPPEEVKELLRQAKQFSAEF